MADLLPAILTGGLGAALGSIVTAVVNTLGSKGVTRADAADRVTHAAGALADRLDKMNTRLEQENRSLRQAMVALTEAVEDIVPTIDDAPTRKRVSQALTTARRAL